MKQKGFAPVIILIIVPVLAFLIYKNFVFKRKIGAVNMSKLFIVQNVLPDKGGYAKATVSEYDPIKNSVVNTQEYPLLADFYISNANQTMPVMKARDGKMYLLLENINEMTGEILNKQEPYPYMIEQVDLSKDSKPSIVYKSENYISQWLLDSENNLIYLLEVAKDETQIVKYDLTTLQKQILVTYPKDAKNVLYHPLILSNDGKFLYETVDAFANPGRNLFLYRINLTDNSVEKNKVFFSNTGWPAETKTTISPDNKYLSFIYNGKVYFFDLQNNKISNTCSIGSLSNMFFSWSADSSNIYSLHNEYIAACQINKQISEKVINAIKPHMLTRTQPKGYIVYSSTNNETSKVEWYLYNLKDGSTQKIELAEGEVFGLYWH